MDQSITWVSKTLVMKLFHHPVCTNDVLRKQEAYKYLRSKLQDLSSSGSSGAGGRLGEDGLHVLHSLLCVLRSNEVRRCL